MIAQENEMDNSVKITSTPGVGKKGGSLDTKNITKFVVWCNSIIPEGHSGEWKVSSTIYFEQIEATTIYENDLKNVNTSDTCNPEGLVVLLLGMGVIFAIVGKNVKYTIEKKHKY